MDITRFITSFLASVLVGMFVGYLIQGGWGAVIGSLFAFLANAQINHTQSKMKTEMDSLMKWFMDKTLETFSDRQKILFSAFLLLTFILPYFFAYSIGNTPAQDMRLQGSIGAFVGYSVQSFFIITLSKWLM